jgi:hypothetical protein
MSLIHPTPNDEVTIGWALSTDSDTPAGGYLARVKKTWDTVSLSTKAPISTI